jgi:hypothetical protein
VNKTETSWLGFLLKLWPLLLLPRDLRTRIQIRVQRHRVGKR